ncbi:hypothetical protein PIB30_015126 [Stylosanthes scabra]|uniref:Uncharacterized protein n=1 Tax=Stylosanthes scabra TaxID=79078 RepID=A0ABU6S6A9_9FABA|nr:hypothetical protein [Stylosanthes scabra]
MEERPIEEIAAEDRREMYRLNEVSHVAHNVHAEKDRCIVSVRPHIAMGLDPHAEPFVQWACLLPIARLTERWFKIDEPLISAFIERVSAPSPSQTYLSPTPETQGTTIPSTMSSASQQAFLDELSSQGFQQMISDIMLEGGSGYRPDTQFDGSPVHLDLNEPVSSPSHLFMTLGGTPLPASHVPGASWDVSFIEPARLPTSPVSPAPAEHPDEPAAPGQAHRASRRRGCGTGGHM